MKIKKFLIMFSVIFIISIMYGLNVNAASISVSPSKSTVAPGESFTVTVSVNNGAGPVSASVSNGSGGLGSTWLDNSSTSFTCTAGSSGSVSIYASGTVADYTTAEDESRSGSATVTISGPVQPSGNSSSGSSSSSSSSSRNNPTPIVETKKSDDTKLKVLSIEGSELSPEFNSNVRGYEINVPNEVTELNITAETNDSKASYSVEGDKDLQVGENNVTITVTAEDGSTAAYIIKVLRANPELALQTLTVFFEDENGLINELPLIPTFSFDILEYNLDKLSYKINKLNIDAIANIEGAIIEITGNEELKEGENIITITLTIPAEVSEETGEVIKEEEKKVYTITFEKEAEPLPPTFWQKIGNWFNGIFGGVGNWFNDNLQQVQTYSLMFCSIALVGISAYMVVDYKKYKTAINKVTKVTEINSLKKNEIISTDSVTSKDTVVKNEEAKAKSGRHF